MSWGSGWLLRCMKIVAWPVSPIEVNNILCGEREEGFVLDPTIISDTLVKLEWCHLLYWQLVALGWVKIERRKKGI